MRQLFIILLLFTSIISYSQTIDGLGDLKFGSKQSNFLALSWVKDSIVKQREVENDLEVFVKNVTFNGHKYDLCVFRFYKGKLYSGIMAKLSRSKETLLQEVDSLKKTIGVEALDFKYHNDNKLDRLLLRDINKNELLVEALNEENQFILRLNYYSCKLSEKRKAEIEKSNAKEEKKRNRNSKNTKEASLKQAESS